MPIESLPVSYLNPGEAATLGVRVAEVLDGAPPDNKQLGLLRGTLRENSGKIDLAFAGTGASEYSDQIDAAKLDRDTRFRNALRKIRGQQYDDDPEVSTSAQTLYGLFKRYDLGSSSAEVKAMSVRALQKALEPADMQTGVDKVGVRKLLDRATSSQAEYERLNQLRQDSDVSGQPSLTELTLMQRETLARTITHLNTCETYEPDVYKNLNDRVNERVIEVGAKARARRSRGKTTPVTPVNPVAPVSSQGTTVTPATPVAPLTPVAQQGTVTPTAPVSPAAPVTPATPPIAAPAASAVPPTAPKAAEGSDAQHLAA